MATNTARPAGFLPTALSDIGTTTGGGVTHDFDAQTQALFGRTKMEHGRMEFGTGDLKGKVIYHVPKDRVGSAGKTELTFPLDKVTDEDGKLMNIEQIEGKLMNYTPNGQTMLLPPPTEHPSIGGFLTESLEEMKSGGFLPFTQGTLQSYKLDPSQESYEPPTASYVQNVIDDPRALAQLFSDKRPNLAERLADMTGVNPDRLKNITNTGLIDNLDLIGGIGGGIAGQMIQDKIPFGKLIGDKIEPAFDSLMNTGVGRVAGGVGNFLDELTLGAKSLITKPAGYVAKRGGAITGAGTGAFTGSMTEDLIEQGFPVDDEGNFSKVKLDQMMDKGFDSAQDFAKWELGGQVIFSGLHKLASPFAKKIGEEGIKVKDWAAKILRESNFKLPVIPSGLKGGGEIKWIEALTDAFNFGKRSKEQYMNLIRVLQPEKADGINSLLKAVLTKGIDEGKMIPSDKPISFLGQTFKPLTKQEQVAKNVLDDIFNPKTNKELYSKIEGVGKIASDVPAQSTLIINTDELLNSINRAKKAGKFDDLDPSVLNNLENLFLYLRSQSKPIANIMEGRGPVEPLGHKGTYTKLASYFALSVPLMLDENYKPTFIGHGADQRPIASGVQAGEVVSLSTVPLLMGMLSRSMLKPHGLMNRYFSDGFINTKTAKELLRYTVPQEIKAIGKWTSTPPPEGEALRSPDMDLLDLGGFPKLDVIQGDRMKDVGGHLLNLLSSSNPVEQAQALENVPDKKQYNQIIEELKKDMGKKRKFEIGK